MLHRVPSVVFHLPCSICRVPSAVFHLPCSICRVPSVVFHLPCSICSRHASPPTHGTHHSSTPSTENGTLFLLVNSVGAQRLTVRRYKQTSLLWGSALGPNDSSSIYHINPLFQFRKICPSLMKFSYLLNFLYVSINLLCLGVQKLDFCTRLSVIPSLRGCDLPSAMRSA